MAQVDLIFPVLGNSLLRDHGYSLYSALSKLPLQIHGSTELGVFPIRGTASGNGTLLLDSTSFLRVRLPAERIPELLPLAGKALDLARHKIRLGVPRVSALVPAAALVSRMVVIKLSHAERRGLTPEAFLESARKQLHSSEPAGLGLPTTVEASIPLRRSGPHAGEPARRVMRIKDKTIVGYPLIVSGLTAEESIRVQEKGLGGRRLMGCGLFLPLATRRQET